MKATQVLKFFCCLALMAACSEKPQYEAMKSIPAAGWHADSSLTFSFNVRDTAVPYYLELRLRHNKNYDYANLFLFRKVESLRGLEYADTAELQLADAYGRWLGSGLSDMKTLTYPFGKGALYFNKTGKYTVTLSHGMRHEKLEGITDVGLALFQQKTEQP